MLERADIKFRCNRILKKDPCSVKAVSLSEMLFQASCSPGDQLTSYLNMRVSSCSEKN